MNRNINKFDIVYLESLQVYVKINSIYSPNDSMHPAPAWSTYPVESLRFDGIIVKDMKSENRENEVLENLKFKLISALVINKNDSRYPMQRVIFD